MWCFNPYLITTTLIIIVVTMLITAVWAVHWYPYRIHSKTKSALIKKSRYDVYKEYTLYTRETGTKVRKVSVLKGLKYAGLWYFALIVALSYHCCLLSLLFPSFANIGPLIYTTSLIFLTAIVFPELFVEYSNIHGGLLRFFPYDLPETPIYWGGLVAIFGSIFMLKQLGVWEGLQSFVIYRDVTILMLFVKIKLILGIIVIEQIPLRAFGFIFAIMIPILWKAPFGTWVSFVSSWLIGLVTVCAFTLLM